MISRETVEKIQDSLKIEEVISDFVTLKRNGAGYVACCPFHNEKTPSFHVSPAKGIFKCFGCGKSGSAISFVMDYEHCSYADALKYIAKKYHIEVEEEELSAEEIVARQKRESLYIVNEFAYKFFISQLSTPEGTAVAMPITTREDSKTGPSRRRDLAGLLREDAPLPMPRLQPA